jgi:hypothetical protein
MSHSLFLSSSLMQEEKDREMRRARRGVKRSERE